MARKRKANVGAVTWFDLTVKNAPKVRDFYRNVVGWKSSPVNMGGYEDFCMNTPVDGRTVAGVCHARGENAELPPQWLIYITVASLDTSLKKCRAAGGKVLIKARSLGEGRMAVIQDPAGAVVALFAP
jgi:predicted enzyme related to lactoylglutathione lyase